MGIRITQLPETLVPTLSSDYTVIVHNNVTSKLLLSAISAGGGGGGSVNFVPKISSFNVSAGTSYSIDTRYGKVSATLPASPSTGDRTVLLDSFGNSATYNIVAVRNGNPIDGVSANLDIDVSNSESELVWVGLPKGWQLVRVQ